jgi:elongation factor Ts
VTETISASLVKQLRDQTGAGMMDCKRALQETDGDLEAAKRLLRERGMASAGKRAGRATTEGLVGYRIAAGRGTMVAVGCETEPVSKTAEFQAFAKQVLEAVEAGGPEAAESLDAERTDLIASLGENIAVAGAVRYEAADGQVLEGYVHPPANKLGVLVLLDGGTPELARQLAMHVSFAAPEWNTRADVPAEAVEAEREIYASTDEVKSKPEAAREKIVEGMLNKRFFAAAPGGVLADQAWIHDSSKSVGQALQEAGATVAAFARLSVAGS